MTNIPFTYESTTTQIHSGEEANAIFSSLMLFLISLLVLEYQNYSQNFPMVKYGYVELRLGH